MTYIITAVVVVAIIAIALLIRKLVMGSRVVASLLTGKFDQSPLGQQLAAWFNEHPARAEQRDSFVQLALGMGCPSGVVADRLMGCIMKVWRGGDARFGALLAEEVERLIVFDPPKTPDRCSCSGPV